MFATHYCYRYACEVVTKLREIHRQDKFKIRLTCNTVLILILPPKTRMQSLLTNLRVFIHVRLSQSMSIAFNPRTCTKMDLFSRGPSLSHQRITEHHGPSVIHWFIRTSSTWHRINGKLYRKCRTMRWQLKSFEKGLKIPRKSHVRCALSSSASRLTVRSTLPSLSASAAFPFLPASFFAPFADAPFFFRRHEEPSTRTCRARSTN